MNLKRWILWLLLAATAGRAEDVWFDKVDRALRFSTLDHDFRAQVRGLANLSFYQGEQSSTGFVFTENHTLVAPQLVLFLDAQKGARLYLFAQARVDRGFDPHEKALRARLDEYAVRYEMIDRGRLNVQVGQFATFLGSWVTRHNAWDNPFVGAPLPYENLTGIYDERAPLSFPDLVRGPGVEEYEHIPIIWGPSYTTGAAVFGRNDHFDYAFEVKNAGPSSRPELWRVTATRFDRPAFNVRLGVRPDMRWKLGVSFSDSAYLRPSAHRPSGFTRGDYRERLFGQDVSFVWHHWQISGELFETGFAIPRAGTVWCYAGYVETRYKFTPEIFGALRVNREVFSHVPTGWGGRATWGEDVSREDLAFGYRLSPSLQIKAQTTLLQAGTPKLTGHLAYAAESTVRF